MMNLPFELKEAEKKYYTEVGQYAELVIPSDVVASWVDDKKKEFGDFLNRLLDHAVKGIDLAEQDLDENGKDNYKERLYLLRSIKDNFDNIFGGKK